VKILDCTIGTLPIRQLLESNLELNCRDNDDFVQDIKCASQQTREMTHSDRQVLDTAGSDEIKQLLVSAVTRKGGIEALISPRAKILTCLFELPLLSPTTVDWKTCEQDGILKAVYYTSPSTTSHVLSTALVTRVMESITLRTTQIGFMIPYITMCSTFRYVSLGYLIVDPSAPDGFIIESMTY
jgi:hypothetical protein